MPPPRPSAPSPPPERPRRRARDPLGVARSIPALLALLLLVCMPPLPAAQADGGTHDELVAQALGDMRDAERSFFRGETRRAEEFGGRALRLLSQAHTLRPSDPNTVFLAVQAAVFAGEDEKTDLWLARYVQRAPYGERDPDLHYIRGFVALYRDGNGRGAVRSLRRMRELAPRVRSRPRELLFYAALVAQGDQYTRTRAREEALKTFREAVAIARGLRDPRKELAARANEGLTLWRLERYADAEAVFAALRRHAPENALWAWYSGLSIASQDRQEEAAGHFEAVRRLLDAGRVPAVHLPVLQQAWLREANCWRDVGRREQDAERRAEQFERARTQLVRYLELQPRSVAGHYWLAELLAADLGRPYDALPLLRRARTLDPACVDSLELLIHIATRHGPPPVAGMPAGEDALRAWQAQLEAWRAELEANAEAWAGVRRQRARESLDGTDACR